MNDVDFNKKLLDIMEYGMAPEVMPGAVDQEKETQNVTYSKTKTKGNASVTVSAHAESMEELHAVLKLAGITLPKMDDQPEQQPEPETPCCGADDSAEMPVSPQDKIAITGVLRDRLRDYLRNSK